MSVESAVTPERTGAAASRAGGSSFYFAMRMLPREQREAIFEVYAFCKAVDDIADGDGSRAHRLQRLADWRRDIAAIFAGEVPAGAGKLAEASARFALRQEDFLAVIEGMEMDAAEDIRAPAMQRLEFYCDRVACAVGRLSVRIFGMDEPHGERLAHHLGCALQLTNILRDIDEDAVAGRLYLPREALHAAGIDTSDPRQAMAHAELGTACGFVADHARRHFAAAEEVLDRFPRRVARVPRIMEEVYLRLFEAMLARGWSPPRRRVRLSRPQLLGIALRHAVV